MVCLLTLSINLKSDVLSKVNSAVLKVARQTWAFLVAYSKDPTKKKSCNTISITTIPYKWALTVFSFCKYLRV